MHAHFYSKYPMFHLLNIVPGGKLSRPHILQPQFLRSFKEVKHVRPEFEVLALICGVDVICVIPIYTHRISSNFLSHDSLFGLHSVLVHRIDRLTRANSVLKTVYACLETLLPDFFM